MVPKPGGALNFNPQYPTAGYQSKRSARLSQVSPTAAFETVLMLVWSTINNCSGWDCPATAAFCLFVESLSLQEGKKERKKERKKEWKKKKPSKSSMQIATILPNREQWTPTIQQTKTKCRSRLFVSQGKPSLQCYVCLYKSVMMLHWNSDSGSANCDTCKMTGIKLSLRRLDIATCKA